MLNGQWAMNSANRKLRGIETNRKGTLLWLRAFPRKKRRSFLKLVFELPTFQFWNRYTKNFFFSPSYWSWKGINSSGGHTSSKNKKVHNLFSQDRSKMVMDTTVVLSRPLPVPWFIPKSPFTTPTGILVGMFNTAL